MDRNELCFLTVREISELIRKGEVSPVEVTQSFLDRIDSIDKKINSYITVLGEEAIKASREAEKAILAGNYLGPFHGVPVAHKDLFCTKGVRTTGSSKILHDFVPQYDAAVVERLNKAGAIMLGKLNTHEFGGGVTTQSPHFPGTKNPWDLERIPGGSSGGSGAAVAAGLCTAATGNDGGGSIRIPSSFCGIVGLKPTFGRVSDFGELPWVGASSLVHNGPMTRSVEDAALMLNILAGYDPRDPSSRDIPVPDYTAQLTAGIKGLKFGVPRDYFFEYLDKEVEEAVETAIKLFEGLGASFEEVSIPHINYAVPTLWITLAEMTSAQQTLIKTHPPQDFGKDVRLLTMVGHFVSAADYVTAQRIRTLLKKEVEEIFERVDALITPTVPCVAVKSGQNTVKLGKVEDRVLNVACRCTVISNLTGHPAISIPCGFTSSNLPIGLQIVGKAFDEENVVKIAYAYEANTSWHERKPLI